MSVIHFEATIENNILSIKNSHIYIYKAHKNDIKNALDNSHDKREESGIYFLINNSSKKIYVGQGSSRSTNNRPRGVLSRAMESHPRAGADDLVYDEVVIITSLDMSLTKLAYLENLFYRKIKEYNSYELYNIQEPSSDNNISSMDRNDCNNLYNKVINILSHLGLKVLKRMNNSIRQNTPEISHTNSLETVSIDENTTFYLKFNNKVARCQKIGSSYHVLSGSDIDEVDYRTIPEHIKFERNQYKSEGKILNGKLLEDFCTSSPTAAAEFVRGMVVGGPANWKTENGLSIKQLKDKGINF